MEEKQYKEILCYYGQIQAAIRSVGTELNSGNIIGRKTSFEYIGTQLDFMYDTIKGLANRLRESGS